MQVSDRPASDPRRVSFKGVDGRYLSFVDIEKDFALWFKDEFLAHLDDASLKANSYPQLWSGQGGEPLDDWKAAPVDAALREHGAQLRARLQALRASMNYGVR